MRKFLLVMLAIVCMTGRAFATDATDALSEILRPEQLESGLTEAQRELIGGTTQDNPEDFLGRVQHMLSEIILQSGGFLRQAATASSAILAVCMACGLCGTMGGQAGSVQPVTIAGILAVSGLSISPVSGMIRLGAETVQSLAAFSQLFLPVLGSAAIASGAVTGGPALYGITVVFADALLVFVTKLVLPLLYVLPALGAADCVTGNSMLKRFRELVSWAIRTGLKAVLYLFTGFLTVTQVISGTADAMTTKAAKLTLSGVVPVVGSIISDASETLLVSAGILKNSVGIYGMLAILSICLVPFTRIGVHYLVLKMTAAVSGTVAQDNLVTMIDVLAETLGLLLAMTGACALLFLISAVCSLKAVGY